MSLPDSELSQLKRNDLQLGGDTISYVSGDAIISDTAVSKMYEITKVHWKKKKKKLPAFTDPRVGSKMNITRNKNR